MTSKISLADRWKECLWVWRWSLRKSRGVGAAFAVLALLAGPGYLGILVLQQQPEWSSGTSAMWAVQTLSRVQGVLLSGLCLLFILILIGALFGYMHDKRAVDLFHALPLGRVPMLLGRVLASLALLWVPAAASLLLCAAILSALFGSPAVFFGQYWGVLWRLMLMSFAALAFSVFVCVCCGNTFNTVLSIVAINICWFLVVYIGQLLLVTILPGMPSAGLLSLSDLLQSPLYTLLSPGGAILIAMTWMQGPAFFAWWAVFGAALLVLAAVLYRRRKSEAAQSSFAFSVPRAVIRVLVTAAAGFGTAFLLVWVLAMPGMVLPGLAIGSVLGHVLTEAVFSRGFHTQKKALPAFGIYAACMAVIVALVATGGMGYVTRVPAAQDVAYVEVTNADGGVFYGGPQYSTQSEWQEMTRGGNSAGLMHAMKYMVYQPEQVEQVAAAHRAWTQALEQNHRPYLSRVAGGRAYDQSDCSSIGLVYHLRDGRTLSRSYEMTAESALEALIDTVKRQPDYRTGALLMAELPPDSISRIAVSKSTEDLPLEPGRVADLQEAIRQDADAVLDVLEPRATRAKVGVYTTLSFDTNGVSLDRQGSLAGLLKRGGADVAQPVYFFGLSLPVTDGMPHIQALLQEWGVSIEQGAYQYSE